MAARGLASTIISLTSHRKGNRIMDAFIGMIVMFGGNFAPRGWAFCNGQLLSIAQNTALFSILGTTYGGNGQTTFALPNLQGRVAIHPGQSPGTSSYSLGETAGTENVTLTTNQMPMHTHAATVTINANEAPQAPLDTPNGAVLAGGSGQSIYAPSPDGATKMNPGMASITVATVGGSQPFSVVQPFQCVNYIICLEGIFPSRN
jgi:microcystin-dependent protein